MTTSWPEHYPEKLKEISWKFNEIAGPNKYWNKHLSPICKNSKLFVKKMFEGLFEEQELKMTKPLSDFISYIMKCFTIYYTEENGEFKISMKKDENNDKIFNENELTRLGDAIGFTKEQTKRMLKHILARTCEKYNKMIKI